jgi:hypothetical protein
VAVKTPPPTDATRDLLREPMAPIGHIEGATRDRQRMIWSIVLLVVLVTALVVGIMMRIDSTPTWEGDWKDLIESPAAYTGDWKDLIGSPAASTYTGDWKDAVESPTVVYTGDWKDLLG